MMRLSLRSRAERRCYCLQIVKILSIIFRQNKTFTTTETPQKSKVQNFYFWKKLMPEKLSRIWNDIFRSWKAPRKKSTEETQALVPDATDIQRFASSPPIAVPSSSATKKIPVGPVQFNSLGDGDKFIHGLEENHVSTKEQLFDLSLRPTSFDARKELKASLDSDLDMEDMILTSKKVQRMHFIGHYNFVNSKDFKVEK